MIYENSTIFIKLVRRDNNENSITKNVFKSNNVNETFETLAFSNIFITVMNPNCLI